MKLQARSSVSVATILKGAAAVFENNEDLDEQLILRCLALSGFMSEEQTLTPVVSVLSLIHI